MMQFNNPKLCRKLCVKKEEAGFSLVEIIVVVVIMGILGRMSTASYNMFNRKTRAFAA